jgi:acyl carrier protein
MSSNPSSNAANGYTLEVLKQIWNEALERNTVNEALSFFDNGGDSLGATIVLSKIRENLDVTISLEDFFDNPTLKELAIVIERRRSRG